MIRHGGEPVYGQPIENTFEAFSDLGDRLGEAVVIETQADVLCPSRPHHLMIRARTDRSAQDALIGAATARALQLARMLPGVAARIYTECTPDDEATMVALETLGYKDDDGLIRMRKVLGRGPMVKPLPSGCTIVRDYLIDETESKFFLERYNTMFARKRDMAWLKGLKELPNFARLLVVSPGGLAGELVTWSDGDAGVVGIISTTPSWQQKGVGSYLVELARIYWLDAGLREAYFDVWTRLTGAVRLAATSGFRPEKMLMRYPGIDVD